MFDYLKKITGISSEKKGQNPQASNDFSSKTSQHDFSSKTSQHDFSSKPSQGMFSDIPRRQTQPAIIAPTETNNPGGFRIFGDSG